MPCFLLLDLARGFEEPRIAKSGDAYGVNVDITGQAKYLDVVVTALVIKARLSVLRRYTRRAIEPTCKVTWKLRVTSALSDLKIVTDFKV